MSQDSATPSNPSSSPDQTAAQAAQSAAAPAAPVAQDSSPASPPAPIPPATAAPAAPAAPPVQSLHISDGPTDQWPSTLLVRFGQANMVGQFRNARGLYPRCGTKVIIQTDRGMEIGEVISVACANCGRAVPGD